MKRFNLKSWINSFPKADEFKEQWCRKHNYVMVDPDEFKQVSQAIQLFRDARVHVTVDQIAEALHVPPHSIHAAYENRLVDRFSRIGGFREALEQARAQWKMQFDYAVWCYHCEGYPYRGDEWGAVLDTYSEWTGTDTNNSYYIEERFKFASRLAPFVKTMLNLKNNTGE